MLNKLQMAQNAAARVLTRTRKYDHIILVLSTLQWLPIKHRIDFKIVLITYKALNVSGDHIHITEFNNEMPLTEKWAFNLIILH